MSKQLKDNPCVGCKFFSVHPVERPLCMNGGNMCNDFSCYREGRVSRSELVALLSEGVSEVRAHNLSIYMGSWLIKASEVLDRE